VDYFRGGVIFAVCRLDVSERFAMAFLSRRKLRVLYIRLVKQTGTPESVARGVAIGFFVGLLIPMGGQIILAVALAFLFRANKIMAMACTWISNPWTAVLIYPFQCYIGSKAIGGDLTIHSLETTIKAFLAEPSFRAFMDLGQDIVVPFFLGGAMLAIPTAIVTYYATYGMIASHRKRAAAKLAKRLAILSEREAPSSAAGEEEKK